jgi:hypothetical protein
LLLTPLIFNGPSPTTGTATTSAPSSFHDHQLTSISAINGMIGPTSISSLKLINNNGNQDNLLPTKIVAQSFTDTIDGTITPSCQSNPSLSCNNQLLITNPTNYASLYKRL